MEAPDIKVNPATAGRAPLQYSLRTMFIVITVLAVGLSGIFSGPSWLSALTGLLLGLATPMILTIALIYSRGYMRTFCIGALFPASLILVSFAPALTYPFFGMGGGYGGAPGNETGLYVGIFVLGASIVIVVLGLVAVGVRWMVEAPQRRQQREAFLREQASHTAEPKTSAAAES